MALAKGLDLTGVASTADLQQRLFDAAVATATVVEAPKVGGDDEKKDVEDSEADAVALNVEAYSRYLHTLVFKTWFSSFTHVHLG